MTPKTKHLIGASKINLDHGVQTLAQYQKINIGKIDRLLKAIIEAFDIYEELEGTIQEGPGEPELNYDDYKKAIDKAIEIRTALYRTEDGLFLLKEFLEDLKAHS